MQKGFTLLELLVVISIIGLLASIVLVSFPGAQKKARLAQGLQFSDSLRASLQADMFAWWTFDETSGAVAKDTWWNQKNGTVAGAQWVKGIINNGLSFDGNDYVDMGDITTQDWTNMTTEAWIYWTANGNGGYSGVYYKGDDSDLGRLLISDAGQILVQNNGYSNFLSLGANDVVKNTWMHIVYTYNQAAGQEYVYVNGKTKGQKARTGNIAQNNAGLLVGFGYINANYYAFSGIIDDFKIYSAALPVSVIQQHYAEGIATHQVVAVGTGADPGPNYQTK